jgi:dihydrofolate reductase
MELIVIVAVAENGVIGNKNAIPWSIKEDFQHFQDLTKNNTCVMGDRTYDSLPENARPLPNRENIILTFNKDYKAPGTKIFFSWDDALRYCKENDRKKVFFCGGASIYKLGLQYADTFELTRIHRNYEGDTKFPDIDFSQWELIKQEDKEGKDRNTNEIVKFSFLTYKRKG